MERRSNQERRPPQLRGIDIPPRVSRAIRIALGIGVTVVGGILVLLLLALNGYHEDDPSHSLNTLWIAIPLAVLVAVVALWTARAIGLRERLGRRSISDFSALLLPLAVFVAILVLYLIFS